MPSRVAAVALSPAHAFSKQSAARITLVEGLGVEGDAHAGVTVQHRSRVKQDLTQPNLRQVHLIHRELLDDLRAHGFEVSPGSLGENILTEGLDILSLPRDTQLRLGADAVVRLTGLRNPCAQLDGLQPGLLGVHFERDAAGALVRRPGVMAVVVRGGVVAPGDSIEVALPAGERVALERV